MNQYQRYFEGDRNFDDPQYKEFRRLVLRRDRGCCQWPKCGSTKRINVHHIKTWAKYPRLRFVEDNGITLCWDHHKQIWNEEEIYERLFIHLVNQIKKGIKNAPRRKSQKRTTKKSSRKGQKQSFAVRYIKAKNKVKRKRKKK